MTVDTSLSPETLPIALVEEGLVLTCDATKLYPWGGFSGGRALFERLRHRPSPRTEILAEVFPPWRIRRPPPAFLDGGDDERRTALSAHFGALDAAYPAGPATQLCASQDIRLAGGVLYFVEDALPKVLHECFRPCERSTIAGLGPDFALADETFDDDCLLLLLDSAGSFNYGHFIVDDLPRLVALDHLPRTGTPVTILMMAYNVHIDEARRRAISMMLQGRRDFAIRFLDRYRRYCFKRLLHVTPSSEAPILKSPDAVSSLADRMRRATRRPRAEALIRRLMRGHRRAPKLFIDRSPIRERELLNRAAVLALVQSRGFEVFDPELTHVGQQTARFAEAEVVVGIMGAAMANTVFCAPGTPLLYLVPEGWDDPFYWDLAASRGHRYAALSGPRQPSSAREHLRPFYIDLDALDEALTRIEALR